MKAVDQAWREAGERFAGLGHELKVSYARQAASEGGAGAGTAATDRQAVEDGLRKLADALDHVATMAGATARDPAVGKAARLAARSLGTAISATLDELSQELRDRLGEHHDGEPGGTAPPPPDGAAKP